MARASTILRAVDGTIQIRRGTDHNVEDYDTRKASWDEGPPAFPYHPRGCCRLVPHRTYGPKQPEGVRVRL